VIGLWYLEDWYLRQS